VQKSSQEYEKTEVRPQRFDVRLANGARGVPDWELLIYTRQFLEEWQTKGLRDTENERVRKYLIPLDIKMRKIRMESTEVEDDWQAVADEDREVADKGRRSFLRRVERRGEYNARGTGCQCLFRCTFE
jgi:hypothetical protein